MSLSLIIPCYNEEESVELLYAEVVRVLADHRDYEMLFVDDGSKDNTLGRVIGLAEKDSRVKYISFSRQFGKEAAMLAGMRLSGGDYVGILDADHQHPPSMIPEMIKALDEGYDVAASRRTDRSGESKIKSFFARRFYKAINSFASVRIEEGTQDFRVMKRKVVESIISMPEYFRFSKGIFSWVGFNTKWIEHENADRIAGKSKFNAFKLCRYAIDGIVSFSVIPLRIALLIGLLVSLAGFTFLIMILYSWIAYGADGTGFSTIICALMLIGGTILLCLGIFGEYLSRIYIEVKRRPNYIVNETNVDCTKR